jgi:Rv2632c-like
MNAGDRWSMEVFVGEIDGETDAEVRMIKMDNRNFSGRGKARLNPADRNVSVIGEEIAIAHALSDLSHKLLHSAAVGVESMAHEKARLHR